MKYIVTFIFVFSTIALHAQTDQQRIENMELGWETVYTFKGKTYQPLQVDGQTFSRYQLSVRDTFITWMQRTYKPVGGLGTVFQRNFTSVQKKGPVPQSIGADFLVWSVAYDKTGTKLEKISETWTPVYIYTNKLMGINDLTMLCSPKQYVFTMPANNYNSTFDDPDFVKLVQEYGLHDSDRFKKYMVYFDGSNVNVVLIPSNQLPIRQYTKGELLQALDAAIPDIVANAKQDRAGNAYELSRVESELKPRWLKTLANLKEKYKDRLQEPAYVTSQYGPTESSLYDFTDDFFVEGKPQYAPGYAVYRFDQSAIEASKNDKPLWISVSWSPQKPNSLHKKLELHKAMLSRFNFEYVYDYFFNPEKLKGKSYAPLGPPPSVNQPIVNKTKELPPGILFFDDFRANDEGSRPAGWFDSRNRAIATVVPVNGTSGKWVQLGHMNELATTFKKPLPENFTLEFDVTTDGFDVRTGGSISMKLSSYPKNGDGRNVQNSLSTDLDVSLTAGREEDANNNNYSGQVRSSIESTMKGFEGNFQLTQALREFTNKKTSVHVTLVLVDGRATLSINQKQVASSKEFKKDYCEGCLSKGVPPGTLFRSISFTNRTQNWSPDGKSNEVHVYISNVKISNH